MKWNPAAVGTCVLICHLLTGLATAQSVPGRPPGLPSTIPDRPLLGEPGDRQGERETNLPVFRTKVEFVEVAVVALDAQGRPVGDLERGDFQLLDEGTPRPIRAFAKIDIPLPSREGGPSTCPAEPPNDVATSALPASSRVFVLLLDDLHVASEHTLRVRRAARQSILCLSEGVDYNVADIMGQVQRHASEAMRSMAATRGRRVP